MKPGNKVFWYSSLSALLILVLINFAVHVSARSSLRYQKLLQLRSLPTTTDCVFLGDSLTEAGCDTAAFESGWSSSQKPLHCENLALGATFPVEHSLILEEALNRPIHLKYLFYGFFDDKLSTASTCKLSDLIGNRAFVFYFPERAADLFCPGSMFEKWELRTVSWIPMVSERSSLWGKVELLRRAMEDVAMPAQKTTRYGRVSDFAALEAKDVPSFINRCQAVVEGQRGFSRAINNIIQLARTNGAQVVFLEMPLPSHHRQAFYSTSAWKELRSYNQALALRQHVLYLACSDWVKDDSDFEDATHLNEKGARLFSTRLGEELAEMTPK